MVKFFIDPGHGGKDPGAVDNGLLEKDLTLKIAKCVKDLLEDYEGVEVKMSRTDDTFPSLSDRTNAANNWGADFFLSIHINAGGGVGYEDFVYPDSSKSIAYQNVIHTEITKQIDMKDRGKKQGNLHVLRESNMPAILTECGFIDNKGDAAKLKEDDFIEKLAVGHVNGLVKAFGIKKKVSTKPAVKASETKFYRVQVGAFQNKEYALALAAELKKKGYSAIIV
ncbi:N-acetylmuramoyl-L-alanine amidase [Peribacillus asahii]|uniref:N-acetylmuramoyl-L-alanine amidase n=1 Tax=Peribacillus asahii TaxID=228899 RepID=UPI0020796A08|nr:N-acetylmuramoyl-L-alanine amidase [Peribacillus asahii]USK68405.1 N-acetylmuramoyl-L-alanine amidase [Peribacillus asahii]